MLDQYQNFDDAFFAAREIERSLEYLHDRAPKERKEPEDSRLSYPEFCAEAPVLIPKLFKAIRRGDFELCPSRPAVILVGKARIIQRFEWHDRFVLLHLARVLHAWTLPVLPDSLYSYRPGRSNMGALDQLSSYIRSAGSDLWILRRDVAKYGESMQHDVLHRIFAERTGASSALRKLFADACAFPKFDEGLVTRNKRGLPTGTFLQVTCENLYLLSLDSELSREPCSSYIRFGDDILFAASDRETAMRAGSEIATHTTKLGVALNEEKSRNLLLLRPERIAGAEKMDQFGAFASFEYLGMEIGFDGAVRLPARKQDAIRKFLGERIRAASKLAASDMDPESRLRLLCGTAATVLSDGSMFRENPAREYLSLCRDPLQLAEFDRWIALTVLKESLHKGFKRGHFRRYPPRVLRSFGLPSISHLRRTRVI